MGMAMVLAAGTLYSTSNVTTKLAYRQGARVGTVVGTRFVIGAIVLWTMAILRRAARPVPRQQAVGLARMGVLYAGTTLLFLASVERVPVPIAVLIMFSFPAIVAVFMVGLRRERLTPTTVAALALAIGGVGLVVGTPTGHVDGIGLLLAAGSPFGLALYMVSAERATRGFDSFFASALILTAAAVLCTGGMLLVGAIDVRHGWAAWPWVVFSGAVASLGAPSYLGAVARLGPTRTSIGAASEPLITLLMAAVFLAEALGGIQLLGGVLVVASVAMLPLISGRTEEAPRPEPQRGAAPPVL
jgi:drug/metabolite transporter (DMT)-like permease